VDRLVAVGGRGDDCGVDTATTREALRGEQRVLCAQIDRLGAERLGLAQLGRIEVQAEYSAAVRAKQLHGQKADEPEPCNYHYFAKRWRYQPDALQADRGDDGERCFLVTDRGGNAGTQVLRHADDRGVLPVRDHAIPTAKPAIARPTSCTTPTLQ